MSYLSGVNSSQKFPLSTSPRNTLRRFSGAIDALRVGLLLAAVALGWPQPLLAASYYPTRPADPRAVELTKADFNAQGDGVADDSDAIQAAINRVQETTRAGVVFVPEGRYRLGKTVYVWQGIRLIGYGAKRPVFVLGRATPGYQEGSGRYMIHFADDRPQPGGPIVDATEFTFYSGMSNIDFELQDGNPAAIAVRFHVAQHSALTHMDFQIGTARAAVEDIGNQASDIHVRGGDYGIITKRTAPVWQFLLMDSSFEGQRVAGVQTMEAGFTLVRVQFKNMPVALQITPGEVEQLYARDLSLENIRDAAFVAGNWKNSHSAVTLTHIACTDVPHFFKGDEPIDAPAKSYLVDRFSLGLEIGEDGRERGIAVRHEKHALSGPAPVVATDVPALPPVTQWVNVHTLGVKGDGTTDDTAALQAAIEQHPVLFLPSGNYRVRSSLRLKPETVLIGLNPGTTQIALGDASPDFGGEGELLGVIFAPKDGRNILSSISIGTGISNPRAVGVVWTAGMNSLMDDVSFPGRGAGGGGGRGRGGPPAAGNPAAARGGPPPVAAGAAPAARGPGAGGRGPSTDGTQPLDLLITNGGGGIFRGNWPHGTNAKVGLRIENTTAPGKIYQISVEHHMSVEVQFHNVKNWEVYALQTEEENPAGAEAYALDIEDSEGVLFANTYMYRVSRNILPKPHAIIARRSERVAFENVKVFSQTRLAFDNAVLHEDNGAVVRSHFFTHYRVNRAVKPVPPLPLAAPFEKGVGLTTLASGFSNASGLTADAKGTIFFTDAAKGKIYRWNETAKKADEWAEISGQPQVLGFVAPNHLLAIGNERAVYHLTTDGPGAAQKVDETPERRPETTLLLPVGLHNQLWVMHDMMEHRGYVFRRNSNTAIVTPVANEPRGYYYAPGTQTAIMAGGTWRPNLQSSQLAPFTPGTTHYLTSEDDGKTYVAKLESDGRITTTVFAERGGNCVVSDDAGNVYIASGHIWIYDRNGKQTGVLEVPERPGSLAFGGADKRTLYIGARGSLYAIRTLAPGK